MRDMIYLCFPWLESNVCRYGDEPLGVTKRTNDSTHDHGMTNVVASESKFSLRILPGNFSFFVRCW